MDLEKNTETIEVIKPAVQRQKPVIIILLVLVTVLLIGWNMKLSAELQEIANQQTGIYSQLSGIDAASANSFSVFKQEIQDMLEIQNSILADSSVKELRRDFIAGTVQYKISATPKTYETGMTVSFVVNDGVNSIEVKGEEDNRTFSAVATCSLTDEISINALLTQGGETQIQTMEKFENMLSESYLWADEEFQLFLMGIDPKFPPTSETADDVFINFENNENSTAVEDVKRVDYYVLVNDKIVVSAVAKPGTRTWQEEGEDIVTQGFKVKIPLAFLENLKTNDHVVLAVLVTDVYGRRYCANSSALTVRTFNKNLILKIDEQYVYDHSYGVNF